MPYTATLAEGQNLWRRLVKESFSLLGKPGRPCIAPLSASVWGGMTTESVLRKIDFINQHHIPFEYIWMDAGWYGADTLPTPDEFEGDWHLHTGDWRVSPHIHPNGLKDISEAIHNAGKKFLLWFEPERVIDSTPIVTEHPEYMLSSGNAEDRNRMLNLGNPQAWEYCYRTLEEKIETLKIDCLRIDFNFDPLIYWQKTDDAERIGITEIKYINGLYRLWDALLQRFPHMIIDNCASGGRRIDIETLRRSVPLWRSDYQCMANSDVEALQMHNQCYQSWMPYSGTGAGRELDVYRIRSAYSAGLTNMYFYTEKNMPIYTEEQIAFLQKYVAEAKRMQPYFSEDFYPLTQVSDARDVWCANQYHRPQEKDGVVQVFRRDCSPYETANFSLSGINRNAQYLFSDADGGTFTIDGNTLADKGLTLKICEKRTAKIYFYKEIEN